MNTRISNPAAALPDITTISPLRSIIHWLISAPVLLETIAVRPYATHDRASRNVRVK